jgi:hypothetical protein
MYENQTVSTLEKDLLKEKLRRLYEAIDEIDPSNESSKTDEVTEISTAIFTENIPAPAIKEHSELQAVLDFTTAGLEETDTLTEVKPTAEVIVDEPILVKEEVAVVSVPIETIIAVEPPLEEERVVESKPEIQHPVAPSSDPALEELFVFTEAKELLEKLRQAPISDIQKALTLNEKLQYAKALFNNDTDKMNHILTRLNQLGSFEQAKTLLISEVVITYQWTEKDKRKLAKDLIQLIKRRYTTA